MSDAGHRSWALNGAAGTPAKQIDLNSATVQATMPVPKPIEIFEFHLTIMNDVGATGIVLLKYRPTAGSTSGEVTIATINLTTAHTQGKIVGKSTLSYTALAGGQLVVEVTDVAAAGDLALASIWGREVYEENANTSDYVETA
jgi:hypothetical protein